MNFEKASPGKEAPFETQFEKVVGGTEADKATAREMLREWLEDTEDIPKKYELSKTKRETEIILETEDRVMRMVQAYGGSPKPMPLEKVHVVAKDKVLEASEKRFREGWHSSLGQYVVVERRDSELKFMQTLAHELFHKTSYKSAQIYEKRTLPNIFKKKKGVNLKRSGLDIVEFDPEASPGESVKYFRTLEEAIVAVMTDRFLEQERSDSRYVKAFENMDKIKEWLTKSPEMFPKQQKMNEATLAVLPYFRAIEEGERIVKILEGEEGNEYKLGYLHGALKNADANGELITSDRVEEQKILGDLLEELVSKGAYGSKEQAFDAFATANFNGSLLPLGKRIDSALGSGTFRKIAERFKDEPKKKPRWFAKWLQRPKQSTSDQAEVGEGSK